MVSVPSEAGAFVGEVAEMKGKGSEGKRRETDTCIHHRLRIINGRVDVWNWWVDAVF